MLERVAGEGGYPLWWILPGRILPDACLGFFGRNRLAENIGRMLKIEGKEWRKGGWQEGRKEAEFRVYEAEK